MASQAFLFRLKQGYPRECGQPAIFHWDNKTHDDKPNHNYFDILFFLYEQVPLIVATDF